MTEFERKILLAAAEICNQYAQIKGGQICQGWDGPAQAVEQFSPEEERALAYNFEQHNSQGRDYDPEWLHMDDGMCFGFYIRQALLKLADGQQIEAPDHTTTVED